MYIFNHQFSETEYKMLDNLMEPVYSRTTNYEAIQKIIKNNYLESKDDDLEYNYNEIISDLLNVLESEEFREEINSSLQKVFDITDNEMEIDFLKPEAIYLGTNFPEEKLQEYKDIIEGENVRIFIIKESDGKLFKALI